MHAHLLHKTWWTFRIFFIFFRSGGGEGAVRGVGREGFIENPRKGGGGPRGRGAGRVSAGNSAGGAKYFFSGPKFPHPKEKFRTICVIISGLVVLLPLYQFSVTRFRHPCKVACSCAFLQVFACVFLCISLSVCICLPNGKNANKCFSAIPFSLYPFRRVADTRIRAGNKTINICSVNFPGRASRVFFFMLGLWACVSN